MAEDEKKGKKKKSTKYNYAFGDRYPGVIIGHKECNPFRCPGYLVPAHMGWLWTATDTPGKLKPRRGWAPGLIGKSVAKLMTFKVTRGGQDRDKKKKKGKKKGGGGRGGTHPGGGYGGSGGYGGGRGGRYSGDEDGGGGHERRGGGGNERRGGGGYERGGGGGHERRGGGGYERGGGGGHERGGGRGYGGRYGGGYGGGEGSGYGGGGGGPDMGDMGDSDAEEQLTPKPTLKIHRKGNEFTIQVNPLKDLTDIHPNEDPYVDCDPMIFKIIKKRSPEELAKMEARKMIKIKKQRDAEIRKALAEAVEDICKCAYMDVYCNDLTALDKVINNCPAFKEPPCICEEESMSSLSSGATWDIEYTPPFGCFDLAPRHRLECVSVETQYCCADAGISIECCNCCKHKCGDGKQNQQNQPATATNCNKRCSGYCRRICCR